MGYRSMTFDGRRGRRFRTNALAAAAVVAVSLLATHAPAQTEEELKAARELFQEAFEDEQEQRFSDALDKFRRVAKVKESPSVRYRIATVLASMGRLREARDMYRALAAAKTSLPASEQEIADSAAERAAELDRRIPKLAVRLPDDPPPDVRVTIDGAPVPVSTTPRAIELDPGGHVVSATARGSAPYEQTVTLSEGGGEVPHTVTFTRASSGDATGPAVTEKSNTLGWIAVGGGAALLATGSVLLAVREGLIDDIETACPNNVCPVRLRDAVESDREDAKLFGPLGGALAVTGLVAIGAGIYMLVRSPSSAPAATTRTVRPTLGGVRLALSF